MPTTESWIRNLRLAKEGIKLIDIARADMPAITSLVKEYAPKQPLRNSRIAVCVIPTPETGVLVNALKDLGASVRLCSDNVISTDDRVAASIVEDMDIPVFGKRDQTKGEFLWCIRKATEFTDTDGKIIYPTQIIDDGSDMTQLIHEENVPWINQILLVSEQTTCGVNFDKGLMRKSLLKVPVVDLNSGLKEEFDNRFGPRESFIPAFKACINTQLGGKLAVVAGFGKVGKGVIDALRMAGARVVITEANAVRATEALMNGINVVRMDQILDQADIVVTATSSPHVLTPKQIRKMKPGAILCNMGENLEYDAHLLPETFPSISKIHSNDNLVEYHDGEWFIYSLCDGYLLNMRTGGNPSRVLGITFALHILSHIRIAEGWKPKPGIIHRLPPGIEEEVAILNFPELQDKLTNLTFEQQAYMGLV